MFVVEYCVGLPNHSIHTRWIKNTSKADNKFGGFASDLLGVVNAGVGCSVHHPSCGL